MVFALYQRTLSFMSLWIIVLLVPVWQAAAQADRQVSDNGKRSWDWATFELNDREQTCAINASRLAARYQFKADIAILESDVEASSTYRDAHDLAAKGVSQILTKISNETRREKATSYLLSGIRSSPPKGNYISRYPPFRWDADITAEEIEQTWDCLKEYVE